jgi:fatty acid desaturase
METKEKYVLIFLLLITLGMIVMTIIGSGPTVAVLFAIGVFFLCTIGEHLEELSKERKSKANEEVRQTS